MKNIIVDFSEKDAYKLAEQNFIHNCGFDFKREKHRRMMEEGLKIRGQGLHGVRIRALISSYVPDIVQGDKIVIDGVELICKAFEQVAKEKILRMYVYVITAGELVYSDEDNIMTQLYSDIWGTAYTDAGRKLLEQFLIRDAEKDFAGQIGKSIYLTNSFGPGFYGMKTSQTKEIFDILDADQIGIEVRESGIMVPLKTCAGLYMLVNDKDCIPHPDCQQCIGNPKGCSFCRIKYEKAI